MSQEPSSCLSKLGRGVSILIRGPVFGCFAVVGLLVLAVVLCGVLRSFTWKRDNLRMGQLASIPVSATEVQISGADNFFNSECFMRFHAPPEQIETFLRNSPSLRGVKPERF